MLCDPERTQAILNAKVTPVSDFVRLRDFDFRETEVETLVEKNVRNRDHFINFTDLATQLTGDAISANMMMLGYAWQQGLVPIGRDAIEQAVTLNGVAVKANIAAFNWGRLLAHDPEAVTSAAGPAQVTARPQNALSTDELIAHRSAHLTKFQNARLAKRYTARLARLAKSVDADALRQAAISYAAVLAYKDEYEVARLYADPSFRENMVQTFEGDYKIAFNLAPPMLPGEDSTGRPKKREFGPWILPVFGVLARFKALRGTWADPFGYAADRKIERDLIALIEADLDLAESMTGKDVDPQISRLLALPQEIRGYGPVKEKAYNEALATRDALRETIKNGNGATRVAA